MSRLVVFNVAGAGGTGGTGGTTVRTVAASVVAVTTVARVDTVPAMAVLCWLNFAMAVIILANSLVVALAKPNQKILEAGFCLTILRYINVLGCIGDTCHMQL